jgi:hypothetical protein
MCQHLVQRKSASACVTRKGTCSCWTGGELREALASAQVRFNVQAALEGLGLAPSDSRQAEEEALQGVRDILKPIMNTTWPSGRPENN